MKILELSVRNLFRYKVRFILTLTGVAASTAVLFSILSFHRGFDRELKNEITKTGIHFMIVPSGCPHEVASLILHGAVIPKFLHADILKDVMKSDAIEIASPILVFQHPDKKRDSISIIYGMEMSNLKALKPQWKITGSIPIDDNEILLGYEIATHEKVKKGDRFYLDDKPMTVSGYIEKTGSQDDAFIFTSVKMAQQIIKKTDAYTAVAVRIKDPQRIHEINERLSEEIPGIQIVTMSQVVNSLGAVANSAKILSLSVALIAFIISALGVMNSILMSAFERTQETGMMRAIGASRSDIFRMYSYETVIQTLTGGVLGIIFALLSSKGIEGIVKKMMPYSPAGTMIRIDIDIALFCVLLSALIGIIVGLYPAWRASRVSPVEAIRS